MIKILYLGNKTSHFSASKSMLETLVPLLGEIVKVESGSHYRNKVLRLLDMLRLFFKIGLKNECRWVLIDVYSTSAFIYAQIIGTLAAFFKKKYILILHGGGLPQRFNANPNSINSLFHKAAHIIAPSAYLQNFFQECGFEVDLIPNVVELEKYPFRLREAIRPKALALRGFKPAYNVEMTLHAINICKEDGLMVDLLLIGNKDEPDYEKATQLVEKWHLEKQVTIMPKMPKEKWIQISEQYDIMISNPIVDNTPVSILEGMALGMVVITTNVGGIPDLVANEKEVMYVNSGDSSQLAQTLINIVYDQSLATSLSKNGRKKVESFDWANVKPQWQKLLYNY